MSLSMSLPRHSRRIFTIDEYREIHAMGEIGDNFQRYGVYPPCIECGEKCKQPNAPGLVVTYCARIGRGE